MMFGLFLNGRAFVRGAASSCYAAARHLDLTTEVDTFDGKALRLMPGAYIGPCDAPAPMLAGDGLTLAGGAPLPRMPEPVTIAGRAA
jgi:hypothetical protein